MKQGMQRQRGVTLISLMVASLIGLFLVGAVLKIYLDSKESFHMRNVVAEVSENEHFAIAEMRRILLMAGRNILAMEDQVPQRRPFPPVQANVSSGTGIVDGGTSESDVIAIRYRTGPSCGEYQDVPLSRRPTEVRFYVNNDKLVCATTTYDASGHGNTVTRTLVDGVHFLKALYGVDDDGDGFANRYLTPSQIETPSVVSVPVGGASPWSRVVSIRFALLLGSETALPKNQREANPDTIELLGLPVQPPDGDHLYRVATATLAFRNLNPVIQRQ